MTNIIKYDRNELLKRLALKELEKLNDLYISAYPKLDYAPMALYDENEVQGYPMLFNLHEYLFIGYFLKTESDKPDIAVARKESSTGWEYHDRFEKVPRFFGALSLSSKKSCSSAGSMAEFALNLPVGSFIQVTGVDGFQSMGFFLGLFSSRIDLAFGYDLESGDYEKSYDISLYRRENSDLGSRGFPERSLDLRSCRQITVMETNEGISGTILIPNPEQARETTEKTRIAMVGYFIEKMPSSMIVQFDRISGSIMHMNKNRKNEVGSFPGAIADNLISAFKSMANLDLAEHDEPQSGKFTYSHAGKEYSMSIEIEYPETGSYSITVALV